MQHGVNQLSGAAQRGRYGFRGSDGQITDDTRAIFPILKQEGSDPVVVGTGFYISHNGIFVTARHCFESCPGQISEKASFAVFHLLPGNQYTWRPVLRAWHSSIADVAVGVAAPMQHNETSGSLSNDVMTLTTERPAIGAHVATYAYAGSSFHKFETHKELRLQPDFYEGQIFDYFPNGRDKSSVNWPVFETSLHIHGGASGGPVVNERGTVFAINTSSFEGALDVSYVTPIDFILDAIVEKVVVDINAGPVSMTIKELARRGFITFSPPFPSRL
jgi:hypothetical protein